MFANWNVKNEGGDAGAAPEVAAAAASEPASEPAVAAEAAEAAPQDGGAPQE